MKKNILAIVAAAVIIPAAVYAGSPLFINTTVDEPLPVADAMNQPTASTLSGKFAGVGDGIHDAKGTAKVIAMDGRNVLRLEDFRSTNGPDLYVYLSTDKDASEYVSLGRLKANSGNQNYEIPDGADLSKYNTVLVWCQQFSVLFGSAKLA
jgi:hypothetical protein